MNNLARHLLYTLDHRKLSNSSGAIAGLATGISVIVGAIAAHFAPRGLHRFAMFLHFAHKPLLLKMAPVIAGVAVAIATAAGIFKFYSWCMENEDEWRGPKSVHQSIRPESSLHLQPEPSRTRESPNLDI